MKKYNKSTDTRVLCQDCLSYNSVFTLKVGDSLLYIQNSRFISATLLGTMALLKDKIQWDILIPPDQLKAKGLPLHEAIVLRLMQDFATRKSSNENGFFVVVTSLNKIGERRIWDLTGDILFSVTFKCPVQKPCKGEILVEVMTQFFIYVELSSISLQPSWTSWISNCRPTPGVTILNTKFGLLNMILSSSLNVTVEMILQSVSWSLPKISACYSSVLLSPINKAWIWKMKMHTYPTLFAESKRLFNGSGAQYTAKQTKASMLITKEIAKALKSQRNQGIGPPKWFKLTSPKRPKFSFARGDEVNLAWKAKAQLRQGSNQKDC